jgi:lipooligosaccharide transport system permease protein
LIAPIFYLSGIFFPIADGSLLSRIVQCSPFYHGVRLLQMSAWNRWATADVLYHVAALVGFAIVLGYWADLSIRKKLIT